MAAAATVGLMPWDGQSRGTLMHVLRLSNRNKPVVVYVQPRKSFVDVRTHGDLSALLSELDRMASLTSRPWASNPTHVLRVGGPLGEGRSCCRKRNNCNPRPMMLFHLTTEWAP